MMKRRTFAMNRSSSRQLVIAGVALLAFFIVVLVIYRGPSSSTVYSSREARFKEEEVEILSWKPRVMVYKNFLTDEECDYIIAATEDRLERSMVYSGGGKSRISDYRTSSGAFLTHMKHDATIRSIEERIAKWTHYPPENGEDFYLLRYQVGQQYKPHHDYFSDPEAIGTAGNRVATVLLYLSDVEEGGETAFPSIDLEVKARKGDAVLFYSYTPETKPDPLTLHAGKPVIKGTKWCMTKWIRSGKFRDW